MGLKINEFEKRTSNKTEKVEFTLKSETLERIQDLSKLLMLSENDVIEHCIEKAYIIDPSQVVVCEVCDKRFSTHNAYQGGDLCTFCFSEHKRGEL